MSNALITTDQIKNELIIYYFIKVPKKKDRKLPPVYKMFHKLHDKRKQVVKPKYALAVSNQMQKYAEVFMQREDFNGEISHLKEFIFIIEQLNDYLPTRFIPIKKQIKCWYNFDTRLIAKKCEFWSIHINPAVVSFLSEYKFENEDIAEGEEIEKEKIIIMLKKISSFLMLLNQDSDGNLKFDEYISKWANELLHKPNERNEEGVENGNRTQGIENDSKTTL